VFDKEIAFELLHFGKFIFGVSFIYFLSSNMDNFFVGRILGTAMLGYYALAYNISDFTSTHLSGLISRVMFPAYASMQNDKEAIKRISLKIMKTLSIISIPFGIVLILLGEEIVYLVYGAKWLPLVPALKILAVCSMVLPIMSPIGSIFIACGKPKWSFHIGLIRIIIMAVSIPIAASKFGLIGAAAAVTMGKFIMLPVSLSLTNKLVGLKFEEIFRICTPAIKSSCVMIMTLYSLKWLMSLLGVHSVDNIFWLGGVLLVTGAVYLATLFLIDRQGILDIKAAIDNV